MVTAPAAAPTEAEDANPLASQAAAAPPIPTEGEGEGKGDPSAISTTTTHDDDQPPPAPSSSHSTPPFSPQDLEAYARDGFVLLHQAFPPAVAAACRERLWRVMEGSEGAGQGGRRIERGDPASWPVKFPLAFVFEEGHGEPWSGVFTPRLKAAVDQLCGKGAWEPFGCGWWMMTFPGHHPPGEWGIDGHWHIDGTSRRRCIHTKEVGVVPILLFSDVHPLGGGTALCRGSHHHVARLLHAAGPGGMHATPLIQQAKAHAEAVWRYKPEEIVEARGSAGDVVFTHPFLVHARSWNCADAVMKGGEGVRFMCHPGVRLRGYPAFGEGDGEVTPLERGVLLGLGLGEGGGVFGHDACEARWAEEDGEGVDVQEEQGQKGQVDGEEGGGEGEGALSLPEGVDEDVWAQMGMVGFGRDAKKRRRV